MKRLILLFTTLGLIGCNQERSTDAPVGDDGKAGSIAKVTDLKSDSVVNTSFTDNSERFLRFEMVVDKPVKETWKLFSTAEGMKTWAAPVVKMDLRVGGVVQTNYDSTAKIGDKGTITLPIANYIPNEMITFKVELNDVFSKKCREEDQNLQEVILLEPVGENQTKIISTMSGWGEGKEWDKTYSFFQEGNKWSYEQLIKKIK